MVEVAPPGAAEDHRSCWDMQTQDVAPVCLSCQSNSCDFFLQCSSLERASRSLAKTGFFVFSGYFFGVRFLPVFLEALRGPLGALGSFLGPFGEHLGVILVTF